MSASVSIEQNLNALALVEAAEAASPGDMGALLAGRSLEEDVVPTLIFLLMQIKKDVPGATEYLNGWRALLVDAS